MVSKYEVIFYGIRRRKSNIGYIKAHCVRAGHVVEFVVYSVDRNAKIVIYRIGFVYNDNIV